MGRDEEIAEKAKEAKDEFEETKAEFDDAREKMGKVVRDGRETIPGGMREGDQKPDNAKGLGNG
jgi:hypothetical protein